MFAFGSALVLGSAGAAAVGAPPPEGPARGAVEPIGPLISITETGVFWPAAAYGAKPDQYLALWVDVADPSKHWQLKGQRLDADTGEPAGSSFHLSPDPAARAAIIGAVTYNPTRHEWFVAYQGCETGGKDDVLGQRIAEDGRKVGGPLPLVVKPGFQNQADVAHNPKNDRYLVVWVEKVVRERQVFARMFDAEGAPAGPETRLSEVDDRMKHSPQAVYNPVSDEFLAVWGDYRSWPGKGQDNDYCDVYGQRIDASTGATIGANIAVFSPEGSPYRPDGQDAPGGIACNTRDGRYVLGVTRLMPKGAPLHGYVTLGMVLEKDGRPAGPRFSGSHPAFGYTTGVGYDPVRDRYLLTWEDAAQNVSGRWFSAAGEPLGNVETVLAMPGGIRGGALAVRPRDGQFLQAAAGDNGVYRGQRFVGTGVRAAR